MRLQVRHFVLSWAVSCTCTLWLAPPAHSQTFLQTLFGFTSPSSDEPREPTRPISPNRMPRHSLDREQPPAEDDIGPPDSGGPYRTMCVRTCDGFYFPIRNHAQHRNFASDIKACRSACGDQARLYYFPEAGGTVDTMTDLAGHAYKDTPQAFAYRKALVSGCSCRPDPWSKEEAARHRGYAEDEAKAAAKAEEAQRAAAAAQSTAPVAAAATPAPPEAPSAPESPAAPQAAREVPDSPPQASVADESEGGNQTAQATIRAESETEAEALMEGQEVRVPTPRRAERTQRRKVRARLARARYVPGETGLFGGPKSRLVWPGD